MRKKLAVLVLAMGLGFLTFGASVGNAQKTQNYAKPPQHPSGLNRLSFSCWGMRNGGFHMAQNTYFILDTLYNEDTPISSYKGIQYTNGGFAIHRVEGQTVVRTFYSNYARREGRMSEIYDFAAGEIFDIERNGSRRKTCSNRSDWRN